MKDRLCGQNKFFCFFLLLLDLLLGEMDVYLQYLGKYKYLEEPNKVAYRLIFFSHRGHFIPQVEHRFCMHLIDRVHIHT